MQLLDSYLLPPGCCAFCRSNALPVIDTGLSEEDVILGALPVEYRGACYLCANCAGEVVRLIGAAPEPVVREMERFANFLIDERDAALHEVERLTRLLDAYTEIDQLTGAKTDA